MKKTQYSIILTGLLLVGITVACNMLSNQVPAAETGTPLPIASPTETATLVPSPTEVVPSLTPTPDYAPFCDPGTAGIPTPVGCQVPIAEQSSVFCTNKIPYNLILINQGAAYEVRSVGFQCAEGGLKDGKEILTCTGLMGSSFELRVCDPACAIPTIQAESMLCPRDYRYDDLRGCCTQEPQQADQNCVNLSLQTKSCVVNCSEISKQAACERNSYACIWDDTNDVCQLRQ